MAINPMLPKPEREKKERLNGTLFSLAFSILPAAIVGVILTFGFQQGLPVTERCHCSWEKVIWFSAANFFITWISNLIGYLMYNQKACDSYAAHGTLKDEWMNGKSMRWFFTTLIICTIIPLLIIYLLLPLLVDQNMNFLWFVQSGMGILCIIVTAVIPALNGFLLRVAFTKQCLIG